MIYFRNRRQKGQAALEYMLLLTVVAVVIFVALKPSTTKKSLLNRSQEASEGYFNTVSEVIMGKNPNPVDGGWCPAKPNGYCECACPAPAFGGKYCVSDGTCKATPRGERFSYCGDGFCDRNTETGMPGHPTSTSDKLFTCYKDCSFQPSCDLCTVMIPSSACGAACPLAACNANQTCMTSNCPTSCPNHEQFCQTNAQRCTLNCRCTASSLAPTAGACGSGPSGNGMCGPYAMQPTQRCYQYPAASCTGTCSSYETFLPQEDAACINCNNGIRDGAETAVDCGGGSCRSCCGNRVINGTEECDDGNRTNGDGCSNSCRIDTCAPTGGYICGGPTPGRNVTTGAACTIPRQCDVPSEDKVSCKDDCDCVPSGDCVADSGLYICGSPTPGHDSRCAAITCTIPQRCDPNEDCASCPGDCDAGACIPTNGFQCGAPTPGQYSRCPGASCSIPQGCDAPSETSKSCSTDCSTGACYGAVPANTTMCPGANQEVTTQTPNKLVASCTGAKCEYSCGPDYTYQSRNAGLEQMCVCTGPSCGAVNCSSTVVPTQCGGSVTLPETNNGSTSVVDCPAGCYGSVMGSCLNGSYVDPIWSGGGWTGSGPVGGCTAVPSCPAWTVNNSTVSNTGASVNCGSTTFAPAQPDSFGVAQCGPNCDGYITSWCDASGKWGEGWSQGYWGCKAKTPVPGTACNSTPYSPPCGSPFNIPPLSSGQSTTFSCAQGACYGGTITASCTSGSVSVRDNCGYCGNGIKEGAEVCDGDVLACKEPATGFKRCKTDCTGYAADSTCGPMTCNAKTVSAGSCGNVILPSVANGATSSARCPEGCSGTLSAVCDQITFKSTMGSCLRDCQAASASTSCDGVILPRVASGQSSSVACPSGCTGGPVSATCTNGTFGATSGSCTPIDYCPAVTQTWGSGACAVTQGVSGGPVGTVRPVSCGPGCAGTRSVTCNASNTWSLTDNTCAAVNGDAICSRPDETCYNSTDCGAPRTETATIAIPSIPSECTSAGSIAGFKNNITTLDKLCQDAGYNISIGKTTKRTIVSGRCDWRGTVWVRGFDFDVDVVTGVTCSRQVCP